MQQEGDVQRTKKLRPDLPPKQSFNTQSLTKVDNTSFLVPPTTQPIVGSPPIIGRLDVAVELTQESTYVLSSN